MKCNKYIELINEMVDGNLTNTEKKELLFHTNTCAECKTEYDAQVEYILIVNKLNRNIPKLKDKEKVIDEIIDKIDASNGSLSSKEKNRTIYLNSSIRKLVASIAALLIMLFSFQQITDAIKIKQLEEKQFIVQNKIDYSRLKLNVLANRLNKTESNKGILKNELKNKSSIINLLLKKSNK